MIPPLLEQPRRKPPKTKLKAVKIDGHKNVIGAGDSAKPRWWRVTVGKRYTGTKKIRKFFDTKNEADIFIEKTEHARAARGRAAFAIPLSLQIEAMELTSKLAPHAASLTDAVTFFLRHRGKGMRRTLDQLIPEYLLTKASQKYRRAQEISLKLFAKQFGSIRFLRR